MYINIFYEQNSNYMHANGKNTEKRNYALSATQKAESYKLIHTFKLMSRSLRSIKVGGFGFFGFMGPILTVFFFGSGASAASSSNFMIVPSSPYDILLSFRFRFLFISFVENA